MTTACLPTDPAAPPGRAARLRRALPLAGSLMMRCSGSLLQLVVVAVITRTHGTEATGLFYLFMTWMTLFCTLGTVGIPLQTMRAVAALDGRGESASANERIVSNLLHATIFCACLAGVVALVANPLAVLAASAREGPLMLRLAALGAVCYAATRVAAEAFKSRRRPNLGLFIESILPLAGVLAFIGGAKLLAATTSATSILYAYTVSLLLTGLFSSALLLTEARPRTRGGARQSLDADTLPLWGTALLNNTITLLPYLLLPHLASLSDIGCFAIAHRLIGFSSTITLALASHFGPAFARAHATDDHAGLRRLFRESQLWSFLAYLPCLVLFTVLGKWTLRLFGNNMMGSSAVLMLAIMGTGRAVNAVAGLTEYYLNMSRRSGIEFTSSVVSAVFFLLSAAALGQRWHSTGVAVAFSLSMIVRAAFSYFFVRTDFAIDKPAGHGLPDRSGEVV